MLRAQHARAMVHLSKPEWVTHGEAGIYSLTASAERVATGGGDHKVRIGPRVHADRSGCVSTVCLFDGPVKRVAPTAWLSSRICPLKRRGREGPSPEAPSKLRRQLFSSACIRTSSTSALGLQVSGAVRLLRHLSVDGWTL